jgi:hypothetical protein
VAAGVSAVKNLVLAFFLVMLLPLAAQENAPEDTEFPPDAENMVGLTLKEVFAYLGQPDTVHAVRGAEEWQDDVVFVYAARKLDVYIYKDRVWQVRAETALGLKKGDRKAAALLALGNNPGGTIEDKDNYLLYHYPKTVWPKYARFNLDSSGRISAIYVYRPDM